MDVSLLQATTDDIPDLIQVHTAAFKTDQFSRFMLRGREENAHQALMQKSIESWFADPTSKLVKAVLSDKTVVGWACWLAKGKDDPSEASSKPKSLDVPNTVSLSSVDQPVQQQHEKPRTAAQLIGRQMRSDSMRWEEDSMKGRRYLALQALATSPSFQCQGIGSKLIQCGIDMADAERLPCWAHASPVGHHLYAKAGFQELGRSEYDLEEFDDGNESWGQYIFRYMQRPAVDDK
jgi:predicted N-acetyltransferase YhbS